MKRACWHISICAKTIKKRSHTQSLHAIMISLIQCANSLLPIFILQRPILSLPRLFCLLEAVKLQYNEQPPCRYQRHRGCVSIIFLLTLRRHSLPVKTSNILSHSAPTTLVADTACDEYIPVAFTTVLASGFRCSFRLLLRPVYPHTQSTRCRWCQRSGVRDRAHRT